MTHIYADQDALQNDLEYWQQVLRLQDWRVRPQIVRASAMPLKNVVGAIEWQLQHKIADLYLLDPIDYPEGSHYEQDHEESLVHELLHLHYAPFDETEDNSLQADYLEHSINAICEALVQLKREAHGTSNGALDDQMLQDMKKSNAVQLKDGVQP